MVIDIDTKLVAGWDKEKAFEKLMSLYNSKNNREGVGLYTYIDEQDIRDLTFYILKYSNGTKNPRKKDIVRCTTQLTVMRLESNKNKFTDFYCEYYGEMTDFHLSFFLEKIFGKYSERLISLYGFDHNIFWIINMFAAWNKSLIFGMEDIKRFVEEFYDVETIKDIVLEMVNKFISYYEEKETIFCAGDINDFHKQVGRKPFIKLENGKYVFFYSWFRTYVMINFHYLLYKDEEYKKFKGFLFEEITSSLLKHAMGDAKVFESVNYKGGEIDVLVDSQDAILIVECKSVILYDDYRTGEFNDSVKRNIESITVKATNQLLRAKEAIKYGKDLHHGKEKIKLNSKKEIILLNICFEFPIGYANKDKTSEVVSLTISDFMIILDQLIDPMFGKPRVSNIIDYLRLRKNTLGFATDDEITIMISLLYLKHLDHFIQNDLLGAVHMDSKETLAQINEFYSLLTKAKLFKESPEYKVVKDNYKGYLYDYIFEN